MPFLSEYLEDYNNDVLQVFACFYDFLFCATHDFKDNKELQNIMLFSKNTLMRELSDFFGKRNPKFPDDWNYRDFLIDEKDCALTISQVTRFYLNKNFLHLTNKRGKKELQQPTRQEYVDAIVSIRDCIMWFLNELKCGNIKPDFTGQYNDEAVQNCQTAIFTLVAQEALLECIGEVQKTTNG